MLHVLGSRGEDYEQLAVTGIAEVIGQDSIIRGTERVDAMVRRARDEALAWVEARREPEPPGAPSA